MAKKAGKLVKCRFCDWRMRPQLILAHVQKRHPTQSALDRLEEYEMAEVEHETVLHQAAIGNTERFHK